MNHATAKSHPTIALVGNPNTGKTTLFNALAGLNQRVGNYPGVTVETKKGRMKHAGEIFDLVDLPGTYSLAPRSPDEMVAVDLILGHQQGEPRPDAVLCIVDASNLERNLYLTTQVLELGVPVVIALNMIDVATQQGLRIDVERLSKQLGVPVVAIQANRHKGFEQLKTAIAGVVKNAATGSAGVTFPDAFEREISSLSAQVGGQLPNFLVRRLLLDVGGYTEQRVSAHNGHQVREHVHNSRQRLAEAGCAVPAVEARTRYTWIRQATNGCVDRPAQRPISWTDRLDRILIHRIWGTLIFLALMFLVFVAIYVWAKPLMDAIEAGTNAVADLLRGQLPAGPLTSLLVDGVVLGVGSVLMFLPQILILFAFVAILEDCGYMARAAFLMDKLMSRAGLSGKSFIPLLSSVACAVPGIMATRVIENRRDRFATILVAPLMSCSARLPVYFLLAGALFSGQYVLWVVPVPSLIIFCMYVLGMVLAPIVAFALKRTLLRGETPVFVMEMPAYKWPSLGGVLRRVADAGWAFVRRAGTVIVASMIVVWALLYFPYWDAQGVPFETKIAAAEEKLAELEEKKASDAKLEDQQQQINDLREQWQEGSYLGQVGKTLEPVFWPLGWDWRLGMAALASFPAREVVVGTLGIIYGQGEVDPGEFTIENAKTTRLGQKLNSATWDDDPGRKVFTTPVGLGLMVFFALCAQCASTLAIIRRETRSWRWPIFSFVYMTVLAYLGAFLVYQIGSLFT